MPGADSNSAGVRPDEPKRLILCLDGTWNRADGKAVTNIVRIRDLIRPIRNQRVYYHTGVGTGLSWESNVVEGATGRGLDTNIRGIYKFLSQNYTSGVEIYVFGFSRGAFTARSLVAYIDTSGLLKPGNCSAANEQRAWDYYRCDPDRRYPSEYEALRKLSFDPAEVRIRALGVFDTVGSLGIPLTIFNRHNRRQFQFHSVGLGTNVDYAFHALAIDEKRGPFSPSLWQYPNHHHYRRVEQVWFPGVHANVGGGYDHDGLSRRSLYWLLSRIERHKIGLQFVEGWQQRVESGLDVTETLDESRTWLYGWNRLRPMIRVINQRRPDLNWLAQSSALPPNAIPIGEMLDYSVLNRWVSTPDYRPENVRAALQATFTLTRARPIPIVREDGETLDWIRNESDRKMLESLLPEQFTDGFRETVDWFANNPDADTSAYVTPFQEPSSSNW